MSAGARRLLLRQGRAHAGALAVVAGVVVLTAFLACAVPRALSHVYDEGLADSLAAAGPTGRELFATATGDASGTGTEPLSRYVAAVNGLMIRTDPVLTDKVRHTTYNLTSDLLTGLDGTGAGAEALDDPQVRLQLRTADDWREHVRVVEGVLPEGALAPGCNPETAVDAAADACLVDMALSVRAASEMGLDVGQVVALDQGSIGPVLGVRLAATFEPVDARADYWSRDLRALVPHVIFQFNSPPVYEGVAFVSPHAWTFVEQRLFTPTRVELRLLTDPAAFAATEVEAVQDALRRLPTYVIPPTGQTGAISLRLRSALDEVIEAHVARQATADAVMSVALAGLLAVALAVLALAARLVTERRRVTVKLAVARGASARQVAGWQALEGLAVAAPAAVTGSVLAAVLVGGRGGQEAVAVPVLLVVATAVLVPALGRGRSPGAGRSDLWRRLAGPGRLVVELSVAALAVAGVLTLRRRGLTTSADELGTDPLLASVPVLLAVAVGIVVLRAFPIPLRSLGTLVARRAGAVPFLGLARSGREVAGGAAPVIVLLLGLTMAVFTSVISSTLVRGGVDASWQNVGADVRMAGTSYSQDAVTAARAVDGVAAVAPAAVSYDAQYGRRDVAVVATEVDAYRDVQRANPVAPPLPASLGRSSGGLPAVASSSLAAEGDQLVITVLDKEVTLDVVATAPTLPGVQAGSDWVLVPLDGYRDASSTGQDTETAYVSLEPWVGDDPSSLQRVTENLRAALPSTVAVTTRATEAQEVAESGLVSGVRNMFAAGVATGAAYATLAVILTLVVTSRQRDVVLSQLRTLGLSGHQARSLVALEIVPLAVAALGTGLALGLATPWLLAPAIDLRPFTGSDVASPLTVDALSVASLAAGFVAVVGVAVLLVTAANRRRVLGSVLRVGEDA